MKDRTNKIVFLGKDNTLIETCIDFQLKDLPESLDSSHGTLNLDKVSQKRAIYHSLLRIFLEIIDSETKALLADSEWDEHKDEGLFLADNSGRLKFGNFIGVVHKRIELKENQFNNNNSQKTYVFDITLQINSRFDSPRKPFFLATLLMHGMNHIFNSDEVSANSSGYYDFLLLVQFKRKLQMALRKGYFKKYHEFLGNDSHLKGSIDIDRHIKLNEGLNNGRIAYKYRENSTINYLNMLILSSYRALKRDYPGLVRSAFDSDRDIKKALRQLDVQMPEGPYSNKVLISKNIMPVSHPYYSEYEAVREISLRILKKKGMSFEGDDDKADGLLYYIPSLWEEYLVGVLSTNDYELKEQFRLKVFEYYGDSDGSTLIKPDFVFFRKDDMNPFMILDAKFKPRWGDRIKGRKSLGRFSKDYNDSLMPDYDECIRNMNAINAHATGVIYPTNLYVQLDDHYTQNSLHNISSYNRYDHFYTFPIFVPESEEYDSYDDWYKTFVESLLPIGEFIRNQIVFELDRSKSVGSL